MLCYFEKKKMNYLLRVFCNSFGQGLSRVISIFMGEWTWRILFSLLAPVTKLTFLQNPLLQAVSCQ